MIHRHAPQPGDEPDGKTPLGAAVHARPGLRTVYLELAPEEAATGRDWHTRHRALNRLLKACSLHRPFARP